MNYFVDSPRELFDSLDYFAPTKPFNGFVIIPTGEYHDSGYCCMKFALYQWNGECNEIVGCVGGGCDVIHLNGIGGYGKNYKQALLTRKVSIVDWNMDILPNGLVRVFCHKELELDDLICSDFNIYAKEV